MARMRNLKPSFFKDEDLCELPALCRILFEGLWCLADKNGNLEDRPRFIKIEVLPYDDCDVVEMLGRLEAAGFVRRYRVADKDYLSVLNFRKHQRISGAEAKNEAAFPLPPEKSTENTREAPTKHQRSGGEAAVARSTEYGVRSTEHGDADDARASSIVVPFSEEWGASPAQRHSPGHAWRSAIGKHIPHFLHGEFADSLTNAGDLNADASLRAWYASTEDQWRGRKSGDDPLKFWRARFAEWQGTTSKAPAAAPVVDYTPTKYRTGGAA